VTTVLVVVRALGSSGATGLLGVGFLRVVCPAGGGWAFWVLAGQAISQTFQTLTQALPNVAQPLWAEHEQDDDEYDEPMPDAHCSHNFISVLLPSVGVQRLERPSRGAIIRSNRFLVQQPEVSQGQSLS